MNITYITQKIEHLAVKTRPVYWLLGKYYKNIVNNEVALASITKNDHVLCVGGGICPASAILLHKSTGAKITVIDNCQQCIQKATEVISKLGLNGSITMLHKDGACDDLELDKFTVVHFAAQVTPMWHVVQQIEARVKAGTKLLVRRPKQGIAKLYSCLAPGFCKDCPLVKHNGPCNLGSTLLYVKAG